MSDLGDGGHAHIAAFNAAPDRLLHGFAPSSLHAREVADSPVAVGLIVLRNTRVIPRANGREANGFGSSPNTAPTLTNVSTNWVISRKRFEFWASEGAWIPRYGPRPESNLKRWDTAAGWGSEVNPMRNHARAVRAASATALAFASVLGAATVLAHHSTAEYDAGRSSKRAARRQGSMAKPAHPSRDQHGAFRRRERLWLARRPDPDRPRPRAHPAQHRQGRRLGDVRRQPVDAPRAPDVRHERAAQDGTELACAQTLRRVGRRTAT